MTAFRDWSRRTGAALMRHRAEPQARAAPSETGADDSPVKMFVPPGHFYSPVVDPAEAHLHLAQLESAPVPESVPGVALDRRAMVETWHTLLPYLREMPFADGKTPPLRYQFDNPAYGPGDGSVLHAMIRQHRPRRIVEVGSGWSSACTMDTVERYLDRPCELTFIEPHPALLHSLIGKAAGKVTILDRRVQAAPLGVFESLQAGDILFIDSTHILRTASDVCFELFEILPRLARGVVVHIHDMFWPFEYPRAWAVDDNRSWNELYAIRAFLTNNDAWRIVMFNDYFGKIERPLIEATYPRFLQNPGGALWLERL